MIELLGPRIFLYSGNIPSEGLGEGCHCISPEEARVTLMEAKEKADKYLSRGLL